MNDAIKLLKDWRLHVTMLNCCMITDRIGTNTFAITPINKESLLP